MIPQVQKNESTPPKEKVSLSSQTVDPMQIALYLSMQFFTTIATAINLDAKTVQANASVQKGLEKRMQSVKFCQITTRSLAPTTAKQYFSQLNQKNQIIANGKDVMSSQLAALRQTGETLMAHTNADISSEPQNANLVNSLLQIWADINQANQQVSLSPNA